MLSRLGTASLPACLPPHAPTRLRGPPLPPRSSLDPVLRMEERVLNPQGLALVAGALLYLNLRPGVLDGAIDTYIRAPLQNARSKVYAKVGTRPPARSSARPSAVLPSAAAWCPARLPSWVCSMRLALRALAAQSLLRHCPKILPPGCGACGPPPAGGL